MYMSPNVYSKLQTQNANLKLAGFVQQHRAMSADERIVSLSRKVGSKGVDYSGTFPGHIVDQQSNEK